MEEGVEKIGNLAFYQCSNLKEVNLPNSLRSIGRMVFSTCPSLEEIAIPEKITILSSETLYMED